jgi:hypothetical protein
MTTSRPGPAHQLTALLETLPASERQEITAWLLTRQSDPSTEPSWAGLLPITVPHPLRWTSALASGEQTQLVTIRLPAERHAELRQWCADHGFTMAAVVRGLVDRFIDQQRQPTNVE